MKLTLEGIKDRAAWQNAGIKLPDYDVQAVSEKAKKHPVWAHFGAGNIFRIFVGGMADAMLEKGAMDRGITCVETFDFDVVDQIYTPYDNLVLAVTLNADVYPPGSWPHDLGRGRPPRIRPVRPCAGHRLP